MIVILAEKPNQAVSYAQAFPGSVKKNGYYEIKPCSVLPKGAKLTWARGHLVQLQAPEGYNPDWKYWKKENLPIIPSQFEFVVPKDTLAQFKTVKNVLKTASVIIIATDCDREGENIARSIMSQAGVMEKPTKRLWINSLEAAEIQRGFRELKDGNNYLSFYYEARARQIGDWLVGMNATRYYTLKLRKNSTQPPKQNTKKGKKQESSVFSVGRVQTPTLSLIYRREKEIEVFQSKPFYELEAQITTRAGEVTAKHNKRFDTPGELAAVVNKYRLQEAKARVSEIKSEIKTDRPPQLHSLSSLQAYLNKVYKYSPAQVLETVQSLYDAPYKLLSYPRTSCRYITPNEFDYLVPNIQEYQKLVNHPFNPASINPDKRYVDGKKVTEHYAIIPTKNVPSEATLNKLTDVQKNVYYTVVNSVLAIFHKNYKYQSTEVEFSINGLPFSAKTKEELEKGWHELMPSDKKNQEGPVLPLGALNKDDAYSAKVSVKKGKTSPPKPYTEGQLLMAMMNCGKYAENSEDKAVLNEVEGIGTEATRASIIENLKSKQYITVNRNHVQITEKGKELCEAVSGSLLAKPELTAQWEAYLKKIGSNQGSEKAFVQNVTQFVKKLIK